MYQSKKELRQDIESLKKRANALASDLAGEMIKVNEFSRENKELRMKAEALEKERDEWHEKYCEEASDLFAAEFSIEEYAGFETVDDLISAYHKALDELYDVRQKMAKRIPVRRRGNALLK